MNNPAESAAHSLAQPGQGQAAANASPPGRVLPRPRLSARLAAARDRRLILLVAQAGYGKTVLLRQWAQGAARAWPILWHTTSDHDNDPVHLLRALADAAECALPAAEGLACDRAVRSEMIPAAEEAVRSPSYALEQLLRRASQRADADLWVVLDEVENLTAPEVLRTLDTVLSVPGLPVRFVMASRTAPQLVAIARLQAEGCVLMLDETELRFSRDESAAFLAASGLNLTPEDLDWLMARCEGWPVALRLLTQADHAGTPTRVREALAHVSRGGPLLDYLAGQVLANQPVPVQAFLRRTALLPYLSPDLCNAYLNSVEAAAILSYVERSHLFVSRAGSDGHALRFHPLFRQFLLSALEETEGAEAMRNWRRRAAACLLNRGRSCPVGSGIYLDREGASAEADGLPEQADLEAAVEHLAAVGDWEAAAGALSDVARQADRAYLPQLGRWCERLPASAVARQPYLLLANGQYLELQGRYGEGEAVLWRAEQGLAAAHDRTGVGQARHWRARLLLRQGHYAEAVDLCRAGLAALPDPAEALTAEAELRERADLLLVSGACSVETGELARAEECYGEARRLYERLGDRRATARALHDLGTGVYLLQGRLTEALEFDQASLRILEQLGSYLAQLPLIGLAWEYQLLGDYVASRKALDRLLRQADAYGDQPLRGYGLYLLGHLHRLEGQRGQARTAYDEARSLGDEIGEPTLQVEPLRGLALLALDEDNPQEGDHLAGLALARARASGYRYWQGLCLAALGRTAVRLGRAAQAEAHLLASLALLRTMGARFEEAAAGLSLAEAYAASGRTAQAVAALEESLALTLQRGYLKLYTLIERPRAIPLLVLALSHGSRAAADVLLRIGRDATPVLLTELNSAQRLSTAQSLSGEPLANGPRPSDAPPADAPRPWADPQAILSAIALLAAIGDERAAPLLARLSTAQSSSATSPLAAAAAAGLRTLAEQPRPVLHVRALGSFQVSLGDMALPAAAWQRRKGRLLLLYLLRRAPQPTPRDELIEVLWPDLPPPAARRALNTTFSDLRRLLEPHLAKGQPSHYLLREGENYRFSTAGNYWYDVHNLERALTVHGATREALALYTGDFLPEEPYVDWVLRERERLLSLQRNAMVGYLEELVQAGAWREACDLARQIVEREPCLEEVWRVLIQCCLRLGFRGEARLAYQACVAALAEEVDAEPDAATRALLPLL